jgi:hypothetical protein
MLEELELEAEELMRFKKSQSRRVEVLRERLMDCVFASSWSCLSIGPVQSLFFPELRGAYLVGKIASHYSYTS